MNELSRRSLLHAFLGTPLLASPMTWPACSKRSKIRTIHDMDGGFALHREKHGHVFRDMEAIPTPTDWEICDVVIVGGGVAGLSCQRALEKHGIHNTVLLELDTQLGGTSQAGATGISAHPWGAHYVTVPMAENRSFIELLAEVGAVEDVGTDGTPVMAEQHLCRDPSERVLFRGRWYEGLYPTVGESSPERAEKRRFEAEIDRWARFRDELGRKAFALPMSTASDAQPLRDLDTLSMAEWLDQRAFQSPRLRWWVDYACRDDYGTRAEDTSAWSGLFYYVARKLIRQSDSALAPDGGEYQAVVTWPEGNARLVRHLAHGFAKRTRPDHAVVSVTSQSAHVDVVALQMSIADRPRAVGFRARYVVMATPQFINARVVRGLSPTRLAAHASFEQSPWMVANLHLRERPTGVGFPLCWDNVLYGSPSLGYVVATHQRGPERGPTVLTYYFPLVDSNPLVARRRLLELSWAEWSEVVLSDLERAHPEIRTLVDRIDIARWGHGMVRSTPGRIWGGQRELVAQPYARVHFAHSDLSGVALFEEAFDRGTTAALQVVERLRT